MKKNNNEPVVINILPGLVEEFERSGAGTKTDIIDNIEGMTKQNFYDYLKPHRDIGASKLRRFRIGLGLSRKDFWKRVMHFFDPVLKGDEE